MGTPQGLATSPLTGNDVGCHHDKEYSAGLTLQLLEGFYKRNKKQAKLQESNNV